MANQTNSLVHTKWVRKYHVVSCPKYRRKIIYKEYRKDLQEIIWTLCKYKSVEIMNGHMMPGHIYLLVNIPPKMSVLSFMGYLKGKSALMTAALRRFAFREARCTLGWREPQKPFAASSRSWLPAAPKK